MHQLFFKSLGIPIANLILLKSCSIPPSIHSPIHSQQPTPIDMKSTTTNPRVNWSGRRKQVLLMASLAVAMFVVILSTTAHQTPVEASSSTITEKRISSVDPYDDKQSKNSGIIGDPSHHSYDTENESQNFSPKPYFTEAQTYEAAQISFDWATVDLKTSRNFLETRL